MGKVEDGEGQGQKEVFELASGRVQGSIVQLELIEKEEARWYGLGESVEICGVLIKDPMIYVGNTLTTSWSSVNDPCLVDPNFRFEPTSPDYVDEVMLITSLHFGALSARAKSAYLSWLASGRSDPKADIAYVFLFFFGIERRVFIDGLRKKQVSMKERNDLFREVARLLSIYGTHQGFQSFALNFLFRAWVCYESDALDPSIFEQEEATFSSYLRLQISRLLFAGEPIPAPLAMQWPIYAGGAYIPPPAILRCSEEFIQLFILRYQKKYKNGLKVKPGRTQLVFIYFTASEVLSSEYYTLSGLTDPFALRSPIKTIAALLRDCQDDLLPYCRLFARRNGELSFLEKLVNMPEDLALALPGLKQKRARLSKAIAQSQGAIGMPELYEIFEYAGSPKPGKRDLTLIVQALERLGLGLAPDPRVHRVDPAERGFVVLLPKDPKEEFTPGTQYRNIVLILRACGAMIQASGAATAGERSLLEALIRNTEGLSRTETDYLQAFLTWALLKKTKDRKLRFRLAGASDSLKASIRQVLLSIVFADGFLDPKKTAYLETLYSYMGMDSAGIPLDLHAIGSGKEPMGLVLPGGIDPQPLIRPQAQLPGVKIDQEQLKAQSQETLQVMKVLQTVFEDPQEHLDEGTGDPGRHKDEGDLSALAALDERHRSFYLTLIEKELWTREELEQISAGLGLFLDGALEVINEWVFEKLQTPLIEGTDQVYVDTELAKEIRNAT